MNLKDKLLNNFPFRTFREGQKELLIDAGTALKEKDVIIIEGPCGTGKSPINISIGKSFPSCFYTSPQVKLVKQLSKDFGPDKLAIDGGKGKIAPLLGRNNYECRETNQRADVCDVRDSETEYCSDKELCTYWKQKELAQKAEVSIMTFAMLISDSFLKRKNNDVSFSNRKTLIVDECQNLEEQSASMFCGFPVSPNVMPGTVWRKANNRMPSSDYFENYLDWAKFVKELCQNYIEKGKGIKKDQEECSSLIRKISYMFEELDEGREWVMDMDKVYSKSGEVLRPLFKPVKVDRFLKKLLWKRAEKVVLSSATIPFRNNVEKWLERIGLEDMSFEFFTSPMTFPKKNRPIDISTMGGKMTYKKENDNWKENVETVKTILRKHSGDNILIHTQSYSRANELKKDLRNFSVMVHGEQDDIIKEWKENGKNILLSPALKEGVDLKGDICRVQILFKVPFPNMSDSRVSNLLSRGEWDWYMNQAKKDVVQSYGRAIRSKDDSQVFYVVDGSFKKLLRRGGFPKWFSEAITNGEQERV